MADFSHIAAQGIPLQIGRICNGERLGDDELLEVIESFKPQLLNQCSMRVVRSVLDHSVPKKRGRPSAKQPSHKQIITELSAIERNDVPQQLLDTIIRRLETGRPYELSKQSRKAHRRSEKVKKDMIMYLLYFDIRKALDRKKKKLEYPGLKPFLFVTIKDKCEPFRQALIILSDIMRHRLHLTVPSEDRILNIISEQSKFNSRAFRE